MKALPRIGSATLIGWALLLAASATAVETPSPTTSGSADAVTASSTAVPTPTAIPAQAPGESQAVSRTPSAPKIYSDGTSVLFAWTAVPPGCSGRECSVDWLRGLIYFGLGVIGALVTVYLFLGESLPSMGGKAHYELIEAEIKDFKSRRDKALKAREQYARGETDPPRDRLDAEDKLTGDFERSIRSLERQLGQERWRLFWLGFPIYLVLGGFFAAALTTNLLQALLIGFGWTAVADRFGLQRESATRKEIKDGQISTIEAEALEQARLRRSEADVLRTKIEQQQQLIGSLTKALATPPTAAKPGTGTAQQ